MTGLEQGCATIRFIVFKDRFGCCVESRAWKVEIGRQERKQRKSQALPAVSGKDGVWLRRGSEWELVRSSQVPNVV